MSNILMLTRYAILIWIEISVNAYAKDYVDCSSEPIAPSNKGWINKAGDACIETSYYKSIGEFSSRLMLVTDTDFFSKWKTPSRIFHTYENSSVNRGSAFAVIVLFANAKQNARGLIDVAIDYKMTKANGEIDGELHNQFCAREVISRPKDILEHCRDYAVIEVKDDDPEGEYNVEVKIRDNYLEKEINLSKSILIK